MKNLVLFEMRFFYMHTLILYFIITGFPKNRRSSLLSGQGSFIVKEKGTALELKMQDFLIVRLGNIIGM